MEKKPMFYGGKVGPWIPVLLMLAGMLASTIIGGGGLNRLTGISFFAISVGFLLCKDKKQFGKITLKGLQNPMLGTILMAYLMAGMLAQLLRQSGLITALIWGISKLGMNAGWIPLIGFIACLLISTSCGTSTGLGGRRRAGSPAAGLQPEHRHGAHVRRDHLRRDLRR